MLYDEALGVDDVGKTETCCFCKQYFLILVRPKEMLLNKRSFASLLFVRLHMKIPKSSE